MDKASRSGGKRAGRQPSPKRGRLRPAARAVPPPPAEPARDDLDLLIEKTARKAGRAAPADLDAEARARAKAREVDARLVATVQKGVGALLDRKAEKVVVLSLGQVTTMADYFVIASATNERQAQALADAVEQTLKRDGQRPLSIEGYASAVWILVDYGDVVFHVFREESRRFYGLERLWSDASDDTRQFLPPAPSPPAS